MEKATVLMRADDSRESGLGHVSRCVGLSQELVARGHVPVFVTTPQNRSAYEIILRHAPQSIEVDDTCNVESLLGAARGIGAQMMVVDSYLLELDAFQELADAGLAVVAIDDLGRDMRGAHIVINPNHGAPEAPGSGYEYLGGEKYFICRKSLEDLRAMEKNVSEKVGNVLIAPGGRDRFGMAELVTGALATGKGLEITLISGPRDDAGEMGNVNVVSNPKDLAEIMFKADIAFAGGGVTKYELAAAGTPTLLMAQVPAQVEYCLDFEKLGTSRYLGFVQDVNKQQVRKSFKMLTGDVEARKLMSQRGRKAVDAKGASRVVDRIEILLSRD